MRRNFDPLLLADLAAAQWGMFTTAQAAAVGATPQRTARMANAGLLERLRHGVYRLTGTPPRALDDARAAWLALDPGRPVVDRLDDEHPGVISHRTAAAVHGLGDLDADDVDLTVPTRKQSRVRGTRFHVEALRRDQWVVLDGLPVTTIATTIRQLAAAHTDGGHLASIVCDAYVTGQVDPREIAATLRPYAHLYGATLGDGEQIVGQFLEETGVPESTRRAAQGATTHHLSELIAHNPKLSASLNRTLADITGPLREHVSRIVENVMRHSTIDESLAEIARTVLANSSSNQALAETARATLPALDTSAIADLAEIALEATRHIDLPAMDTMAQAAAHVHTTTEQARQAVRAVEAAEATGLVDRTRR